MATASGISGDPGIVARRRSPGNAAAGQRRGMFLGFVVGLASGPLFLLIGRWNGALLSEVAVYGQPVLSLVGGWFGGELFPPIAAPRRRISPI